MHDPWPAEFGNNGVVKARRMPPGHAAKMQVTIGDINRNGVEAVENGWYYKWYRGLHCLCGLQRQDLYKHRSPWENQLSSTWYFDMDYRCHDIAATSRPADIQTLEVFIAEDIDVLNEAIADILELGDEDKCIDDILRQIIEDSHKEEWEDYDEVWDKPEEKTGFEESGNGN